MAIDIPNAPAAIEFLGPDTPVPEDPQRRFPLRKALGAAGLMLACGAAGAAIDGIATAFTPTHIEIGPHQATARLTLNDRAIYDLGPFGYLDKPTGWGIGYNVTIKGVPTPDGQSLRSSLAHMGTAYEQLWTAPGHIKENVMHTVESRLERNATVGGIAGGTVGTLLAASARRRRRQRQSDRANALDALNDSELDESTKQVISRGLHTQRPPYRRPSFIAAGIGCVLTAACGSTVANSVVGYESRPDPALSGTFLEGFSVHGAWLQGILDEVVPKIENTIQQNQAYYDLVKSNFQQAFQEKFGSTLPNHVGLTYIQSISDEHCNIGMETVHGAVADAFKVDVVADSGDLAMSGTSAEEECVATEADAVRGPHRTLIFSAGNHDSPTIEDYATKYGYQVLHLGKTVTAGGLRWLGESDVNESVFGQAIHPRGNETPEQETDQITKAACQTHPDILMVHEPEMATPAVSDGCTSFSISGHTHVFARPTLLNSDTYSYQFVEGTSGGAKPNSITVLELKKVATDTILVANPQSKRVVGYYLVSFYPDTSVRISNFQPLAEPNN